MGKQFGTRLPFGAHLLNVGWMMKRRDGESGFPNYPYHLPY